MVWPWGKKEYGPIKPRDNIVLDEKTINKHRETFDTYCREYRDECMQKGKVPSEDDVEFYATKRMIDKQNISDFALARAFPGETSPYGMRKACHEYRKALDEFARNWTPPKKSNLTHDEILGGGPETYLGAPDKNAPANEREI